MILDDDAQKRMDIRRPWMREDGAANGARERASAKQQRWMKQLARGRKEGKGRATSEGKASTETETERREAARNRTGKGKEGKEGRASQHSLSRGARHSLRVSSMDTMSSDDHHVVVGRMEMGPDGLRLLEENGDRLMYGEKPLDEDEKGDVGEHHHGVYEDRDNGDEHNGGYGVGIVNGKHDVEDEMEPKLGGLGAAMLKDVKLDGRERQMSEGDFGTTNSPQVGKSGRRSSRDPAIEWSEGATTVLLQAFGEKYRALDRGNFTSKIWADIATRVNTRGSLPVMQCLFFAQRTK